MSAIPTRDRIISLILLSLTLAVLAQSEAIIAYVGVTFGATIAAVVTVGLLAIREYIKEAGLQDGELQSEEQVKELVAPMVAQAQPEAVAVDERGP